MDGQSENYIVIRLFVWLQLQNFNPFELTRAKIVSKQVKNTQVNVKRKNSQEPLIRNKTEDITRTTRVDQFHRCSFRGESCLLNRSNNNNKAAETHKLNNYT